MICFAACTPRKSSPTATTIADAAAATVAAADAAPPTWPHEVDLSLTAPDGFHLISARGDDALVLVTGMIPSEDPTGHPMAGSTSYVARFDLRTGCMTATYDFRSVDAASSTGTVSAAMEVLGSKATTHEVALAKKVSASFGPNDLPIRVTPNGRNVVLEANNEIYWSKDNGAFIHVPGVAKGPLVSLDGAFLLYGSGGGTYRPSLLDFATGVNRAVTRKSGNPMHLSDSYALSDGSFIAVETDGGGLKDTTRACVGRIDPKRGVETEAFCIPSEVISASFSEMSADSRYLAIRVEHRGGDRIMTFETATWKKVTDAAGFPNYMDVDDRGRVGWNDIIKSRIAIADGASVTTFSAPAGANPAIPPTFVGFVGHRVVVGHPSVKAFAATGVTLRDVSPCGHLQVVD